MNEITLLEQAATEDYRVDPQLKKMCEKDSQQFCSGVEQGEGAVQSCLRENLSSISWDCRSELERQEAEDSDDIRLSTSLYKACLVEKKKFCSNLPAGNGRVIQCLIDNKTKPGFTSQCATELIKVIQKRMEHLEMDPIIRKTCSIDIGGVCGLEDDDENGELIIKCLQDFKDELQPECKTYIHQLTAEKFEDVRLDVPLLNACQEDRSTYCADIPAGSARVIHCLQDNRKKLSPVCKATLFDQEVKMAEDIDFKYKLKSECNAEISRFCADTPSGNGRVIRCLEDNMNHVEFSKECRIQMNEEIRLQAEDYRLNFRLKTSCQNDINKICANMCKGDEVCGGVVLQCLTEKMDEIENEDCYNEVFYFVKMEVTDFRNDLTLAEQCREDVDAFCKDVSPGEGRIHKCLRMHMAELKEGCRTEELKIMQIQSRDVRLQPVLMKACQAEMYMYCLRISPGGGRVFKCLQKNLGQPDFGADCANEVQARSQLMQTDYRFDYGIKTHCQESVGTFCSAESSGPHQRAAVLNCLIKNYQEVDDSCSVEVTRAVRMALWTYKAGAAITMVCDADVNTTCSSIADRHKKKAFGIGVVGRCLSRQVAEGGPFQSKDCKRLITISAPKDISDAFFAADSDSSVIVEKLKVIEQRLGASSSTLVTTTNGYSQVSSGGYVLMGTIVVILAAIVAFIALGVRNVFSKTIVVKNAAV
eukprot:TRINITY_DN4859_c0_g2_i4.p1 TRINITY_DN4859_c0_g2~~TRINITY_DN4859_c0_g2_i4.p1  ORF type:complete len:703 (+),score=133.40 TRINITY_DN4859_c0_g2_i4:438-2546(+)